MINKNNVAYILYGEERKFGIILNKIFIGNNSFDYKTPKSLKVWIDPYEAINFINTFKNNPDIIISNKRAQYKFQLFEINPFSFEVYQKFTEEEIKGNLFYNKKKKK